MVYYAIVSMPCNSEVEGIGMTTTVYQCPKPMVQGPKMPLVGYNKVDTSHKAVPAYKYPEKKKAKKKAKKKRKSHRG